MQANKYNALQILTSGNNYTLGFSIGQHFDCNDMHGKEFHNTATSVLSNLIKLALESNDKDLIQASNHLLRMGTIDDTNNLKYSLYTVCGYAAEYEGDGSTERKVSALFVYNSIDVAVRIPIGKIGYNLFNGIFTKHQTAVPFTYDDEFVYMNDQDLNILAWGPGKSDKLQFMRDEYPNTVLTQRCSDQYFAGVIHGLGQVAVDRAI